MRLPFLKVVLLPLIAAAVTPRPAASSSICTGEALRDIVEILKTVVAKREFVEDNRSKIHLFHSSKYDSANSCDLMIKDILSNSKKIEELRKIGKTEELKETLLHLLHLLDELPQIATKMEPNTIQEILNARQVLIHEISQADKNHDEAVKKLVIMHLQNGDVKPAVFEFLALENRDALAEELVQSAYSNSKVQLLTLAKFVCMINFFTTAHVAINALYLEMAKNNQLKEKEVVLLYFRLQSLETNSNFASQNSALKNNYLELEAKLAPHKQIIMTSMVDDIKEEAFTRPNSVLEVINSIDNWPGEQLFMTDLVKTFFTSGGLSFFEHLYKFAKKLGTWSATCYALAPMYEKLKSINWSNSMEALAVWSYASEIAKARNIVNAQCQEIASEAPAYKQTLITYYTHNIKYARTIKIKELHRKYVMNYFFRDYINSLSLCELTDNHFNRLIDAIADLPYIDDSCSAANAVHQRFQHFDMLGTFEHFQMLQIVKKMKGYSNYENTVAFYKSKCENAAQDTPSIFQKLLSNETSDCKLINRFFDEPLYCTSGTYTDHGYRYIFTWIPKDDDSEDQHWSINVSDGIHGVYISNKDRTGHDLRYIFGRVVGSRSGIQYKQMDYFRIDTIDDDYILLQPISEKVYVAANVAIYSRNRRLTTIMADFNDQRTHWKLVCH